MFYTTDTDRHGLPHDPFKPIIVLRPMGRMSYMDYVESRDGFELMRP